jgi:hypothetical protein
MGRKAPASNNHQKRAHTHPLHGVEVGAFPRLRLSEAQWTEVVNLSGIPAEANDARRDIEIALGMYRQWQANTQTQLPVHEIRSRLVDLRERAKSLCDDLLALLQHEAAYEAASGLRDPTLSHIRDLLISFPKWLTLAWDRVGQRKRGPQSESIYWLIAYFDSVRKEWTGKRITRSKKWGDTSREYIAYLCAIADSSVGSGTIEKAMSKRISTAVD